jgi:hypothetical protein
VSSYRTLSGSAAIVVLFDMLQKTQVASRHVCSATRCPYVLDTQYAIIRNSVCASYAKWRGRVGFGSFELVNKDAKVV